MIHPQCLEKYLCSSLFMLTNKQDVCMPKIVALWLDRHRDSGSLNQLNFSQVTSTFMQIRTSLASVSMSHPSRSWACQIGVANPAWVCGKGSVSSSYFFPQVFRKVEQLCPWRHWWHRECSVLFLL